ncbi:MAG: hypothetical protein CM1200mP29_00830 [Verrucomicrobiota bacterium]|nr:MAG: hypothetical protein CM1200mP29_00830 [Verrucomicrobiota bacterium]
MANGATSKVLVPTNGKLGTTWTGSPSLEPFDTTGWLSGPTGVGYDRATGTIRSSDWMSAAKCEAIPVFISESILM